MTRSDEPAELGSREVLLNAYAEMLLGHSAFDPRGEEEINIKAGPPAA